MSPVAQNTIDFVGWRDASVILGLVMIIFGIPLILFYLKPQLIQVSDKNFGATDNVVSEKALKIRDMSVTEALKSDTFWLTGFVSLIYYYGMSAILFHQASYLTDANLLPQNVAKVIGALAAFAACACLLVGPLIDKYKTHRVLIFCFLLQGTGVVSLLCVHSTSEIAFLIYFVVAYGIALGATDVAWCVMLKEKFGKSNYGSIFGFWYLFVIVMLVSGAIIAGLVYDSLGSYFFAFAAVPIGGVIAIVVLRFIYKKVKHDDLKNTTFGIDKL